MKTTDQEPPAETAVDDGPSSMSRRASGKKYQRASRSDNMSLDGTDSDDDSSMLPATTSAEIEPNNVVAAGTVVADGGAAARRVGVQDHTALDPSFVSSVSVTVHRMECTVGQMVKTSDVPPHKRRRFGPTQTKKKPDFKDQGGEEGGVVGKSNTDFLQIKEEQEELWTSPLEEADIMKMTSTPVPVKSEDDVEIKEEQGAYSLSRTSTEQIKMEPDGVDCGLLEPKLEEADLSIITVHTVKCEQMTDDSDEWESETSEPHPGSKSIQNDKGQSLSNGSAASSRKLSQRIVKKTSKAQEAGEDITLDMPPRTRGRGRGRGSRGRGRGSSRGRGSVVPDSEFSISESMPKAKAKPGRPRPEAGQLTLLQALSRAVRERDLHETDDDEPEDTGELEPSSEEDEEEEAPPSVTRRARLASSDEEESEGEEEEEHLPTSSSTVGRKRAGKSHPSLDPPSWRDMSDWSPKTLPFTAVPGPSAAASLQSDKPVDFVELFFCDELLLLIVDQTNKYAEQCFAVLDELRLPYSRVNAWQPLTLVELKRFLGLLFLTGIIKKQSIAEYWSVDVALETPYFRTTMPRNRFQLILRFLHFGDNGEVDDSDRLHKVRLVVDLLLSKFRDMYQPSQNISVDEGMMHFRGRLRCRVYSPVKPIKYGIKSYILCDSANGYCYSMKPYCGTHRALQDTVRFLIGGLEGFGYRLWMDHCYNSESMCRLLLGLQIHSAGTLRVNRVEPPSIRQVTTSDLAVGEQRARHNDAVMVLAWRDKRIVRMISTFHQDEMTTVEVRQRGHSESVPQRKPACVVEYNQYMSGVDHLDQKILYYPFISKTAKWSSKFVMYLMQIAMSNAFIVYRERNPTTSCKTLKDFILSVVISWHPPSPPAPPLHPPPLAANDQPPPPPGRTPVHPRKRSTTARLDVDFAGHVPLAVEVTSTKTQKKSFSYRKCGHCAAKGVRKDTKYVCPNCDHIPLCLYPCYFEYHSQ